MSQGAPPVSLERIMQLFTGHWASAMLATGVQYGVFTHIDRGHRSCSAIAKEAQISPRGAQALLDGLVGIGMLRVSQGEYANPDDVQTFLVKGKPTYFGDFGQVVMGDGAGAGASDIEAWAKLPAAVKSGNLTPTGGGTEMVENPFWEVLVPAIAPLAVPAVETAKAHLGIAQAGEISTLDVGGGSGIFSALFLAANPKAKATQVDWANINAIGKKYVSQFGVGDRFKTIDGDFHTVDWGNSYDVGIYSNIAHQESPHSNIELFRKFRKAIKPGGTLVVSDFVQADDRSGPPFALLFHANMLLMTPEGATYRQTDYRSWLGEADFKDITFTPTPGPSTLIFAK